MLALALMLGVLLAPWSAADAQSQSVHGTLRAPDGTPVAGVTIIAARNGAEVGKDTTAKDGTWEIPQDRVVRWLDQFAQLLVEGIKFGSIIAICAVGLSLIFAKTSARSRSALLSRALGT